MTTRNDLAGTWHNQHGSILRLEVDTVGRLSGEFRSHSGLATPSDPCRVSGFVATDLVAFVVDFGRFDSLTTWAGHRVTEGEEECLRVCWQMTVALPMKNAGAETWRGVWTGEDEFRRAPFAARSNARRLPSHPLPRWP